MNNFKALEFVHSVSRLIGSLETDESVSKLTSYTNDISDDVIATDICVSFKMERCELRIGIIWDVSYPSIVEYKMEVAMLGRKGVSYAVGLFTKKTESELSQIPWDLSGIMNLLSK